MSDDLAKRLDNLWSMLEEEGFYTKANTVTLAKSHIEALEAKLAACEKYRDAYAEFDRIGTQAVRDLEAKLSKSEALLAKAVEAIFEAIYLLDPDEEDIAKGTGLYRIVTTFKELKGQDNEH